jgi:hypothetical protein
MAKNRNINVIIKGEYDNTDVQRAMRELQRLQRETGATGGVMGGFGKVMAGVGASLLAAFSVTKVIDFMQESAKAAMEDQVSMVALAKAMENVGLAGQNANVEAFVQKLSLANGVADDQLRPNLQKLITVTGDVETSQKALALALDISKGSGRDLSTVTLALSKGYSGQATALGRLGVGLDKALLKSGDMVAITGALSDKFGGQAAAAAQTYQGKMDRITVAAGEAKEAIGYSLLNAIDNVSMAFGGTNGAVNGIASFGQETADAITGIGAMVAGIANATKAIDDFIKRQEKGKESNDGYQVSFLGFQQIIPMFANYGKALTAEQAKIDDSTKASTEYWQSYINTATGVSGVTKEIGQAEQDLIAAFKDLNSQFSNVQSMDAYKKSLLDIKDALDKSSRSLNDNTDAGLKNRDSIIGVFDNAVKAAQAWGDETGATAEDIQAKFATMTDNIRAKLIAQGFKPKDIDKFLGTIGVWENGAAKIPGALAAGAAGTTAVGVGIGKDLAAGVKQGVDASAAALGMSTAALVRYAEQAARREARSHSPSELFADIGKDLIDGLVQGIDLGKKKVTQAARDQIQAALDSVISAVGAARDAGQAISDGLFAGLDFENALIAAHDAGTNVIDEIVNQANRAAEFGQKMAQLLAANLNSKTWSDLAKLGADKGMAVADAFLDGNIQQNVARVNDAVKGAQFVADQVGSQSAQAFQLAGITAAMAVVTGLLDTLGIKGKGRKALENMMDNLAASLHRTVSLTVETTGAGASAPASFSSAGVANPFGLSVPDTTPVASPFPAGFSNPFNLVPAGATGGIVNVPTVALIGEAGPEAVVPLSGSAGNSPLGAMGGGGNNYAITVNTGVGDPRAIGQEVISYIKRFEQANGPVFVSA